MSGPKSGSYHVVSAAELARRRLVAAKDRHGRAADQVRELAIDIAAANATYGSLGIAEPTVPHIAGDNADTWERSAEALTEQCAALRQQLDGAVAGARAARLAAAAAHIKPTLEKQPPAARPAAKAKAERPARNLDGIIERLPADASEVSLARCEQLAEAWHAATSDAEREKCRSSIQYLVQQERDRARRRNTQAMKVEALYRQLDGLTGRDVELVRGRLRGVNLEDDLPPDLTGAVDAVRVAAEAERDRDFVLAAASTALSDLGYAIGDDFVTSVPVEGALLPLPGRPRHGLVVRERKHQLQLNVVRFDDGTRDVIEDTEAEKAFCTDFARMRAELADLGVDLSLLRADAPGQHAMQIVQRPGGAVAERRAEEAPRERVRDR